MTETSIPQQGLLVGDASLAPYSADAFSLYMSKLIGYGASRADYGIIRGNAAAAASNVAFYGLDTVATNPATTAIVLKAGTATVKGTLYENDADLSFTVAANASGNPRIDTLILRKDYVAQTVRAVLKQGTAAASPVPPTLTQSAGATWEIALADIAVANGFSSIAKTDITPRDAFANIPDRIMLDQVKNVSGGELITGDVVVFAGNTNEQLEATTTTTENDFAVGGVWIGRTASNGYGRVLIRGLGLVNVGSTALGGDVLFTHTVAKQAAIINSLSSWGVNQLGRLANTTTGTGLRLAYINPRVGNRLDYARVVEIQAQNTQGGTFTNGAWRTRTLNAVRTTQIGGANQFFNPTPAANIITLPAGLFIVRASAPAFNCDGHQTRLNVNAGTSFIYGTSEYAPTGVQTRSFVEAVLSSGSSFSLEHRCVTTRATDGLGKAANLENEVYAVVEIYKLSLPGY